MLGVQICQIEALNFNWKDESSSFNKERKKLYQKIVNGKNKFSIGEIVNDDKEIYISFAVALQRTEVKTIDNFLIQFFSFFIKWGTFIFSVKV